MHLLEVESLTKRFGGLVAVNNVSFNVDEGEMVGIIGPNGAGKTTLFNLITGYLKPDLGKVRLRGEDITALPPNKIANKGLARTFQIVRPFRHLPTIANILVALQSHRGRKRIEWIKTPERKAMEMLEDVGLSEMMLEPAENLSHGDLKRLEIARAMALEPEIVLLDEPLGGLNPVETEYMVKSIQRMHLDGHTMVIVEHKLHALMKLVKRVLVMHYAEVIAEGTPEEIASNKKVIEVYLGKAI
ncbi:MAG: ABC transporter ATP-binding protein [Candidatus Bathyarchaeia archaeon]|nr:ABC transporter ATP-binding protein [Candidatus Bathyarchaeia archaeon]